MFSALFCDQLKLKDLFYFGAPFDLHFLAIDFLTVYVLELKAPHHQPVKYLLLVVEVIGDLL